MVPESHWNESTIKVDEAEVVRGDNESLCVTFVIDTPEHVARFRRMMDKIHVAEFPTFADHLGLVFTVANVEINP